MRRCFGLVLVFALLPVSLGAMVSTGKSQYIVSHSFQVNYVIDQKQTDYISNLFKHQLPLQVPNAGVVGCRNFTRVCRDGAKDFGVGATCEVRSGNNRFLLLLCENSRLGRLRWAESQSHAPNREAVVAFIEENCLQSGRR
ncbi:MAG: hypothetical protein P4L43_02715 [Syntrophobacteraceae bacterium]|nr:hypothetical protein [Syntrophobacteraceae bacterium]